MIIFQCWLQFTRVQFFNLQYGTVGSQFNLVNKNWITAGFVYYARTLIHNYTSKTQIINL